MSANTNNQKIVEDALTITKFLNEHLETDFCSHCRKLVEKVFSNDLNAVGGGPQQQLDTYTEDIQSLSHLTRDVSKELND